MVAKVIRDFDPSNPKFAAIDDPDFGFEPPGAFTLDRDDDGMFTQSAIVIFKRTLANRSCLPNL